MQPTSRFWDVDEVLRLRQGKHLVFTNGCFDILTRGHTTYLAEARKLGDMLVVGVNTDRSVRAYKGPGRPINSEEDRAEVLAALRSVDHVLLFDEDMPATLIRTLQPETYVKGGDYDEKQLPEASIVRGYGGEVKIIDLVPGRSTTNVLRKLGVE